MVGGQIVGRRLYIVAIRMLQQRDGRISAGRVAQFVRLGAFNAVRDARFETGCLINIRAVVYNSIRVLLIFDNTDLRREVDVKIGSKQRFKSFFMAFYCLAGGVERLRIRILCPLRPI
jgi:hypothetical protein